MRDAVVFLAKVPRLGHVKTRLAIDLGEHAAFRLAELFLVDLLQRFVPIESLRVVIAGAQDDRRDEFVALGERHGIPMGKVEVIIPNTGSVRMDVLASYTHVLADSRKAVLMPADMPFVSIRMVNDLLRCLDSHELAFHLTVDGSMGPHAMKTVIDLFSEIKTSATIGERFRRITEWGVSYCVFPPVFDIDTVEELRCFYYWQKFLEASRSLDNLCPNTLAFLNSVREVA